MTPLGTTTRLFFAYHSFCPRRPVLSSPAFTQIFPLVFPGQSVHQHPFIFSHFFTFLAPYCGSPYAFSLVARPNVLLFPTVKILAILTRPSSLLPSPFPIVINLRRLNSPSTNRSHSRSPGFCPVLILFPVSRRFSLRMPGGLFSVPSAMGDVSSFLLQPSALLQPFVSLTASLQRSPLPCHRHKRFSSSDCPPPKRADVGRPLLGIHFVLSFSGLRPLRFVKLR